MKKNYLPALMLLAFIASLFIVALGVLSKNNTLVILAAVVCLASLLELRASILGLPEETENKAPPFHPNELVKLSNADSLEETELAVLYGVETWLEDRSDPYGDLNIRVDRITWNFKRKIWMVKIWGLNHWFPASAFKTAETVSQATPKPL